MVHIGSRRFGDPVGLLLRRLLPYISQRERQHSRDTTSHRIEGGSRMSKTGIVHTMPRIGGSGKHHCQLREHRLIIFNYFECW